MSAKLVENLVGIIVGYMTSELVDEQPQLIFSIFRSGFIFWIGINAVIFSFLMQINERKNVFPYRVLELFIFGTISVTIGQCCGDKNINIIFWNSAFLFFVATVSVLSVTFVAVVVACKGQSVKPRVEILAIVVLAGVYGPAVLFSRLLKKIPWQAD